MGMNQSNASGGLRGHHPELPPFTPSIDTRDVFRALIEDELRGGRLTRARRKRIVQYATQLHMSAVEAGELIEACRLSSLRSEHPVERRCALRLVRRDAPRIPTAWKVSLVIAAAIVIDLVVLKWLA